MLFPDYRGRRMRQSKAFRRMVRETKLSVDDLILPLQISQTFFMQTDEYVGLDGDQSRQSDHREIPRAAWRRSAHPARDRDVGPRRSARASRAPRKRCAISMSMPQ